MKRSESPSRFFLMLFLLSGLGLPVTGQSLDEVLFSVGTTVEEDGGGTAPVYLLWQASDLSQLKDRPLAVYSKAGTSSSSNPYQYEGIARARLQPAAILALLARGSALGDEQAVLENNLDNLFEELIPANDLPLEDKISAVVGGALDDPEQFENLIFLSRRHPTLSLVLGTGFSETYPVGMRTFELRACPDVVSSPDADCSQVVGRITVDVGTPEVLPAPGRPVEVPFTDDSGNVDPRAHLNVPVRWSMPDGLRERSLLQFGFNLYRVEETLAEDSDWDGNAPEADVLADLAEVEGSGVVQVNKAPILPERMLSEAEAADTVADPETYFHIDDNDRFDAGGEPFVNGDRYYYYVAARDLLGRIGQVSEGTEVLICDRQPPPQAKRVRVENHYDFDPGTDTNTQHFRVSWEAPELGNTQTPESIAGYRVYRWWSIDEMQQNTPFPDNDATETQGGLVATLGPGARSFIDNGEDAPYLRVERLDDGTTDVDQSYANKTFWYTVRTIDGSACGGNLGGNSAPAYGVLRDRIGPAKASGRVLINCVDLRVVAPREVQIGKPFTDDIDPNAVYLRLQGFRKTPGVRWVEFAQLDAAGNVVWPFGRYYFSSDQPLIEIQEVMEDAYTEQIIVGARMSDGRGLVSGWYELEVFASQSQSQFFDIYWEGEIRQQRSEPNGDDCTDHGTAPVPGLGTVPVEVEFELTPTTEEWKVYRRVDDGELTLLRQGLDSPLEILTVVVTDNTLPAADSRICYFVQLFDEHGNPSPMVRLDCVEVEGKEAIPTPMLAPPQAVGSQSDPRAGLSWFCPPYGVHRFVVEITADNPENLPNNPGDDISSLGTVFEEDGQFWIPMETRLANGLAPGNSPEFAASLDGIVSGVEYTLRVKAVGPTGRSSEYSNEESFTWNPDGDGTVSGPNVPWPALGLPELSSLNGTTSDVYASLLSSGNYYGAGIRVGKALYGADERPDTGKTPWRFAFPRAVSEPETLLFTDLDGESLLPFVLYRYQEPNGRYPEVSGDVYQVSPMMESIATNTATTPPSNEDPFILLQPSADEEQGSGWYDLMVKDTQPMVRGAQYRYLLVRYDPRTREIVEVIPTNPIEIE